MIYCLFVTIVLFYLAQIFDAQWLAYFTSVFYIIAEKRYDDLKSRVSDLEKRMKEKDDG